MIEEQRFITTPDGLAKLQVELKQLKDVDRPYILQRIKDAKDLGDLAENADYQDAKEQQAFVEGRIMELENLLKRAEVVEHQPGEVVDIGSSLTVRGPQGERVLRIVGPTDANPTGGYISHESPMGKAFLGRRAGETVSVATPSGVLSYTILSLG